MGITTLEEVFLKIGHEDDQDMKMPGQAENGMGDEQSNLLHASKEEELDNYSISKSQDKGLCDQLW